MCSIATRAVTHVKKKKKIVYTFVKLSRPRAAILEKEKNRYVSQGGSKRYRVNDNFETTCSVPEQILSNKRELT